MSAERRIHRATLAESETQEEWRRNGFRLQLVSRSVFSRLGYRVLKGEEDPWEKIEKDPVLLLKLRQLTPHLRDHADYIVEGKQGIVIVDVKAPAQPRIRGHSGRFGRPMTFSRREWEEYQSSKIPVAVLLWDYNGSKELNGQDEPLFYVLLDFRSLHLLQRLVCQIEATIGSQVVRSRKLGPGVFRRFLRETRAMEVTGIEPGRIIYAS